MTTWVALIITGALLLLIIPAVKMQIIEANKPAIGPGYTQRVNNGKPKRKNKRWSK